MATAVEIFDWRLRERERVVYIPSAVHRDWLDGKLPRVELDDNLSLWGLESSSYQHQWFDFNWDPVNQKAHALLDNPDFTEPQEWEQLVSKFGLGREKGTLALSDWSVIEFLRVKILLLGDREPANEYPSERKGWVVVVCRRYPAQHARKVRRQIETVFARETAPTSSASRSSSIFSSN